MVGGVALQARGDIARTKEVCDWAGSTIGAVLRVRYGEIRFHAIFFHVLVLIHFLLAIFDIFFLLYLFFLNFFFFYFLYLFHFFGWNGVFFTRRRTIMNVSIRGRGVNIIFASPTAVTAMSNAIAIPCRYFSARRPFNITITMSTFNGVSRFTFSINFRRGSIFVVPTSCTGRI